MRCRNPYTTNTGMAYGCGQCMPCRINKRRLWTHRILLEAAQYKDNTFLTLTYNEEHKPKGDTLVPEHPKQFLKNLRKRVAARSSSGSGETGIRYFCVGEYGERTHRPHYHMALFNYPRCPAGASSNGYDDPTCCIHCREVHRSWGKGRIQLGDLGPHSAAYIAGYVTKKMTSKDDQRLNGRFPEFARMSLKPGIGATAIPDIASVILSHNLEQEDDVPNALRHGPRVLPLGRYLTGKLRVECGKDAKAPQSSIDKAAKDLLPLRMAAKASKTHPSLKEQIRLSNQTAELVQAHRERLFPKRQTL